MSSSIYSDELQLDFDIFTSASLGCENSLDFLHNRDINSTNSSGWTSLMYASYYGHSRVVKKLIDAEADIDACNKQGRNALILAAMCGKNEVCHLLLFSGAKVDLIDFKEWTALFYATYFNQHSTVKLLLEFGANSGAVESRCGFTPFLLSAFYGHQLIFQYFLYSKANLKAKLKTGETVEEIATKENREKILQLFRNAVCCIETKHPSFCFSDLASLLSYLGLEKYYKTFEEQNVDLEMFLKFSDHDLKQIGINLMGPRRKMTEAISRWNNKSIKIENKLENKLESDNIKENENENALFDDLLHLCNEASYNLLKIKEKIPENDENLIKLEENLKQLNFLLKKNCNSIKSN